MEERALFGVGLRISEKELEIEKGVNSFCGLLLKRKD